MRTAGWLQTALLWSCAPAILAAQDPVGVVFAFVQSGPAGCPAPGAVQEPGLDPAFFPGCWLPPSQCPPFERAADGGTPLLLPFAGLQAGAPCLLVASPIGSAPVLSPCFQVGHDVLGLVVADPGGRAAFTVRTPALRLPLTGVLPLAWAQVYALDPSWSVAPPVLASSRALRVEARF